METKERKRPSGTQRPAERRRPPRTAERPRRRTEAARVRTADSRRPERNSRRSQQKRRPEAQQVVYTDPKTFSSRKFTLQLLTVLAVVLAVLFGMSIFFKVDLEKATVAGNVKYTVNEVMEASGIRDGSNLLTLSDAQITGRITAKLPYVSQARVGIKLPDTVNIEIKELDVSYSVESEDGTWWLMGANGKIVDGISMSEAKTYTQLLGIKVKDPAIGEMAEACDPEMKQEDLPEVTEVPAETQGSTDPSGNTKPETAEPMKPVLMTGSEQLSIVLSILQNLEANGIIGEAASLNVTDPNAVEMWYGSRYQVSLGTTQNMPYKISMLKAAVDQMGIHQSGHLDVSFTTWPDKVGYTPFA